MTFCIIAVVIAQLRVLFSVNKEAERNGLVSALDNCFSCALKIKYNLLTLV